MASQAKSSNGGLSRPPGKTRSRGAALPQLRSLERLFAGFEWSERRAFAQARRRVRERTAEALDGCADTKTTQAMLLMAAAELYGAAQAELATHPPDAHRLSRQLEDLLGLPPLALAWEVLRAPELLSLPPARAVEQQLGALIAFAPVRSVSLWTVDDAEQVTCTRHVGEGGPSRGAKQLAQRLLAGKRVEPSPRGLLLGLPVGRWQQPFAALVGSARPGMRERCHPFLVAAVPVLGAVLERDGLLAGNAASERALVESSERKLTRLGFDLHDGPIQEVAMLAQDLRLLRDQLDTLLVSARQRELVGGRMEDLEAELGALDAALRRLSNEVHAPVLLNRPFSRALRDVTLAFAARTGVEPGLVLNGELQSLSVSQQIALLNIIQEALTNIREHSDATEVEVAVSVTANGVRGHIADNGHGFDLEATLMRAAREGRLGLVAIHERVRLLGGQCRIDSRRGGPTVISVALERWEPVAQGAEPIRASA